MKIEPKRKIVIFFIFFVVLGIIAPIVVFYSLGYRFDRDKGIIVYSGSIVLKPTPFNAEILLNGKLLEQKQIDLINRSLNINGLRPGIYDLEVRYENFKPWKKKVEVHSGIATEFWNVILVPELLLPKDMIEGELIKYAISPNKKKIAYFVQENEYISFYVKEGAEKFLVTRELINERVPSYPSEIKWSSSSEWLIFSFKKGNKEKIQLINSSENYQKVIPVNDLLKESLTQGGSINKDNKESSDKKLPQEDLDKDIEITSYQWDEQNNIYFISEGKLYSQSAEELISVWDKILQDDNQNVNSASFTNINDNLKENDNGLDNVNDNFKGSKTKASPILIKENMAGFTFCGGYLCLVSGENKKVEIIDERGNVQKEVDFPEGVEPSPYYQVFAYGEKLLALVDKNSNLFIWDEERSKKINDNKIKFLFQDVRDVYFSDDGKKLLFSTKNEVFVYFVRDWEVQPKHKATDLNKIYSQQEDIVKIHWFYDYQNIFVVNKNEIKFIELDSRGGRNISGFYSTDKIISDTSYDTAERKFYFVESKENNEKKLIEIPFPSNSSILSSFISGE